MRGLGECMNFSGFWGKSVLSVHKMWTECGKRYVETLPEDSGAEKTVSVWRKGYGFLGLEKGILLKNCEKI